MPNLSRLVVPYEHKNNQKINKIQMTVRKQIKKKSKNNQTNYETNQITYEILPKYQKSIEQRNQNKIKMDTNQWET